MSQNNKYNGWVQKPIGWEETDNKYRLEHKTLSVKPDITIDNIDVIIVMAGGLEDDGKIYPWVKKRLDLAIELYRKIPKYILCTGGGTYHKPPILNKKKYVIHESTACAEYLITNGVNPKHIIKEWGSYDSLASVYFCLMLCIIPRNWDNICVITSSFHMERVRNLFKWIFGLHNKNKYNFLFLKVNDEDNVPKDVLDVRIQREKNSVKHLKNVISSIKTIKHFNEWLYTEHKSYSCLYLNHKEEIPDSVKKSY